MNMKKLSLFFVVASLLLFAAACGNGNGEESAENTDNGSGEAGELSGEVAVDGSSTVFPIMEAVAEEYAAVQPGVQVPVGVSGTGGGFEKFIAGETDLSNASRPIKDAEKQALEEAGIEFTEFTLAYDGLSVVVNPENDWVDQLTIDELKKMWLEDGGVKTWADVREGWPEEPIEFYSPGTDSGTFDYWNEVILEEEPIRKDATLSEDDNVLVQGVEGSKNAIGYFGYAYYVENQDKLKVVPIVNSKGEAVEPNSDTIQDGSYEPLSRPLFTYVKHESVQNKEHVYDFVKFTLENAAAMAEEVGYVALPDEQYQEQLATLDEITGK